MAQARPISLTRPASRAQAFLALARPSQWLKNGVVLAALVFSRHLFDPISVITALTAVVAFCAISSAVYALNDLLDREADRVHPEKRFRPIAAGDLSVGDGVTAAVGLCVSGLILSMLIGRGFVVAVVLYLLLQLAYSAFLKRIVIADLIAIALGFVLRACAGGVAIGVEVSHWLVFTTFLLALLIALGRRRAELIALGASASSHRSVLSDYTQGLIDQLVTLVSAATLVAYMIYTASPEVEAKLGTQHLYLTVPFVAFGLFRYLYLVNAKGEGGDPSRLLLKDRQLLASMILWIAADVAVLYV
ncbi:MAG TPA: decaprenyl-phosphate phosphoribosyltransferase [Candidatus Binataceae bacterium]|jgi:4-hydroxybenzoate polyprenyltransferase